jgi:hypothetical protein
VQGTGQQIPDHPSDLMGNEMKQEMSKHEMKNNSDAITR